MTKEATLTSSNQIKSFLKDKDNKKYHYNDHKELNYKISSGSLNLDLALDGGLPAGVHRFTGVNEGGKTSCALSFAKNFQDFFKKDGKVIYIKSEGEARSRANGPSRYRRPQKINFLNLIVMCLRKCLISFVCWSKIIRRIKNIYL